MKAIDIIFALICGRVVGFAVGDFLAHFGIHVGVWGQILLWIVLPLLALACLWLAQIIGRKWVVAYQLAKHGLSGAFATIFDLKFFQLLFFLGMLATKWTTLVLIIAKGTSFITSTAMKYWANKYWAFEKHEQENVHQEAFQFFLITAVGLLIDVTVFTYLTKVAGPQFNLPTSAWVEVCVLTSALIVGAWNFLGYKFLVFKK